jgi:hypothetical protein
MGKLALASRLQVDDVASKWEDSRQTVISALGEMQDGVTTLLNGTLSTRDNTSSDYGDYTLTHNTPVRIKNPLVRGDKVVPVKGIYAVKCIGVEVSNGKPTRKLYSLATPRIDWALADSDSNNLIVTAAFPLDHAYDRLMVIKTANQSATSSIDTIITWAGVSPAMTRGTALQWDSGASTRITVKTAGDYVIYAHLAWENNATGQRTLYIYKNGANLKKIEVGNANTFFTQIEAVFEHPFVAGDYIEMVGVQVSGGALNALGAGALTTSDTVNRCSMIVKRAYDTSTPTGRVTLFFFGG